jgi:hypothetical protein
MHTFAHRAAAAAALAVAACAGAGRAGDAAGAPVRAAHPDGASGPLEVARTFYAALHRGDAAAAGRLVASPNAGPALTALVTLARSYQSLESAVADRFGAEARHEVGYSDRVAAEDAALAAARAEVSGDRAVVRSGEETLATLDGSGGRWRILLEEQLATEEGIAALVLEAESSRDAAARVVPAIRGGLFDAAADALEAFKDEVTVAMQGGERDLPRPPRRAEPREPGGVDL